MNRFALSVFLYLSAITIGFSQNPRVVKISEIESLIVTKSDKIQVINFWATWCAPCVKEMPILEKANLENGNIKVTLVSLDLDIDPSPEKVFKFVERKKITSRVLILDEHDPNSWIDKIDNQWSGALPATLLVNTKTGNRKFIERELREGELDDLIKQLN